MYGHTNKLFTAIVASFVAGCVLAGPTAHADPLGAGDGAIFRLNPKSTFQEGCFPPCLCPILIQDGMRGTMKLTYGGFDGAVHHYRVSDVNLTVPRSDGPLRIVGAGTYRIGTPDPVTVLQHRMELGLRVADSAAERFDSGWIPVERNEGILITVSMNDMYCYDTALTIDASRVPAEEIQSYALHDGSTFQRGCYDPCDCLLGPLMPMVGTFDLVPLIVGDTFSDYAVVNAVWEVLSPDAASSVRITGFGTYALRFQTGAAEQRLALDLKVGDEPRTHFDSGLVPAAQPFPIIDAVISIHGIECFDTVMHVVAAPKSGEKCGGFAGIGCPEGQFCKLPAGHCCCDFFGTCAVIPETCPRIYDPVCGCDGKTYANECLADAAAVSVDYFGECRLRCIADSDCPEPEQFCKFPEGTCGDASVGGLCMTRPGGCPDVWDPVCGCNGVTYSNECDADAAGVSILHRSECDTPCDPPCPSGQECFSGCGELVQGVECVLLAADDGRLFVLDTIGGFAAGDRVRVTGCVDEACDTTCQQGDGCIHNRTIEPCGQICGGFTGVECDPGWFCKFPEGICSDAADHTGMCTPIPDACPEYFDPVCGCDGNTYDNECFADAAAVSILHRGPCEPTDCPATRQPGPSGGTYCPGVPLMIRVTLTPPDNATTMAVEDRPPPDWEIVEISHEGAFDPINGKVKWGPLLPPFPPEVWYVVLPNDALNAPCFEGTVSVDGVNEPVCGIACFTPFCPPHIDPDLPQPPCDACPNAGCEFCGEPGQDACGDGSVTLCEVIGYACQWKAGCSDDIATMTRATFLWRHGECYCWSEADGAFFPVGCPAPPSGLCPAAGAIAQAQDGPAGGAIASIRPTRSRTVSKVWQMDVPVTMLAPGGVAAAALEMNVPPGWKFVAASDDGVFDEMNGKVKWGPFTDDLSRTVVMTLRRTAPHDRLSLRSRDKWPLPDLSGTVSFDGRKHPVRGR